MSRNSYAAQITAVAHYLPDHIVSNVDLEGKIETDDGWIQQRTGIRERRIADATPTSDIAVAAIQKLFQGRQEKIKEVDGIICATCTPDYPMPATACVIQHKLALKHGFAFDLNAACAGFVYGLGCAKGLVEGGLAKSIILVGAEKMSSVINWEDRNTAILFGDGAGVLLLERGEFASILGFAFDGLPEKWSAVMIPAGGSAQPASIDTLRQKQHAITMQGRDVFRLAVDTVPKVIQKVLSQTKVKLEDVRWLVAHQANIRIIRAVCEKLSFPFERCIINIYTYGNTSAASVPIALSEAESSGKLHTGDKILLCAFGAGLSFGACLIEWR